MIDTHAHLNDPQFDQDRDGIILRAFASGIEKIIEIADVPEEWEKAIALCERYPKKIYCALGFHPHWADQWNDYCLNQLSGLVKHPSVVAIGEIGLDYAKSKTQAQQQTKVLTLMIEFAANADKPIVIHCRNAHNHDQAFVDLFKLLQNYWNPPWIKTSPFSGVIHCFSGTSEHAQKALNWKLALGADGPVTYPKNNALRTTLELAGLERIVLETDSPYLPPQSIRGQRNDPFYLKEINAQLARIFQKNENEIISATNHNAKALFRI